MIKWLIKTLIKAKVNRELNKIKKENSEDFKQLDNKAKKLRAGQEQLDFELEFYCKLHPDSPLCKNRGKKMKY